MRILVYTMTVLVFAGLIFLVLWLLAIRPRQPVKSKVIGLLQLVAVYTLILGLLSGAGVFDVFGGLQRDLTAQDPLVFLAGNLHAFAIIFAGLRVALDPNTSSSTARFLLGLPVLLLVTLLVLAYAVVHFAVIVPVAYFGYLLTSVPIDAILNAGTDVEITLGTEALRIKALVSQNEAAIRNYAVAVPAMATSLVLKIGPLLRRGGRRDA